MVRIVFAGTPEFAAAALSALIEAAPANGWSIPLVLTQPERPSGRGLASTPSAVAALARQRGLPLATPRTLSPGRGGAEAAAALDRLREARPDVLVVAAYGLILPQPVLDVPSGLPDAGAGPLTAINIHASLLPRWRGAAPVARAIEAGDTQTGITLMQMDAGLDTGPMLLAEALPIALDDTAATLMARLATLGARMIVSGLQAAARGGLRATPQPAAGVSHAHKLDKREAWLDFARSAAELARQVRAFDPFPVACTQVDGVTLKLWSAVAQGGGAAAPPGTVVCADAGGVRVACGDGVLNVLQLQRPGGRRLAAREFLAGFRLAAGKRCTAPGVEAR